MPRNIRPILERHFDIKRMDSSVEILNAIKADDPLAVLLREQFGDNVRDWAKELDKLMYGYVTEGPENYVRSEAARVMKEEMGLTKEQMQQFIPVVERLASAHRGQYNDLVQMYIGRMNRPNIERIMDHFFLFWPVSYQIKAATWLYRIMFQRIGGIQTNALGAYAYDEYRKRWDQEVQNNPDLAQWMDDHDTSMFAMEMMFPITPSGIGVSLSRPTRYVGSWIADGLQLPQEWRDAIGEYPYVNDIPSLLENSVSFGPIRTERMFGDIFKEWQVPFFYTPSEREGPAALPTR